MNKNMAMTLVSCMLVLHVTGCGVLPSFSKKSEVAEKQETVAVRNDTNSLPKTQSTKEHVDGRFLDLDKIYSDLHASYPEMEGLFKKNKLSPQMYIDYQNGLRLKLEKSKEKAFGRKYAPVKILYKENISKRKRLVKKDWSWSHDEENIKKFYKLFRSPSETIEYKMAFNSIEENKTSQPDDANDDVKVSKVASPMIVYLYKSKKNEKLILIDPEVFIKYAI